MGILSLCTAFFMRSRWKDRNSEWLIDDLDVFGTRHLITLRPPLYDDLKSVLSSLQILLLLLANKWDLPGSIPAMELLHDYE